MDVYKQQVPADIRIGDLLKSHKYAGS